MDAVVEITIVLLVLKSIELRQHETAGSVVKQQVALAEITAQAIKES